MNPTRTLPTVSLARDTVEALQLECGEPRRWVFWLLAGAVSAACAALPCVQVGETVRAAGAVRPEQEPVAVRAPAAGLIAAVFVGEHGTVVAGQPLLEIAAPEIDERRRHLAVQAAELDALLSDLAGLTALPAEAPEPARRIAAAGAIPLRTSLYERERAQLLATLGAADTERRKLVRELDRVERLAVRGLVTERELDAVRFALAQRDADDGALAAQTLARWQAAQRLHERERDAVRAEERTLEQAKARRTVRAAVAGDLLGFAGGQPGVFVAEGQPLGTLSPGGALRIEAAVRSRDLAQLAVGLPARVEIEALPATEWGFLEGTVETVPRDVEWNGGAPYHRLVVRLSVDRLTDRRARTARLQKGMAATVRVVVGRRSLWHYLTESADRWLERPAAENERAALARPPTAPLTARGFGLPLFPFGAFPSP